MAMAASTGPGLRADLDAVRLADRRRDALRDPADLLQQVIHLSAVAFRLADAGRRARRASA